LVAKFPAFRGLDLMLPVMKSVKDTGEPYQTSPEKKREEEPAREAFLPHLRLVDPAGSRLLALRAKPE
jgi:hypothetical protein